MTYMIIVNICAFLTEKITRSAVMARLAGRLAGKIKPRNDGAMVYITTSLSVCFVTSIIG